MTDSAQLFIVKFLKKDKKYIYSKIYTSKRDIRKDVELKQATHKKLFVLYNFLPIQLSNTFSENPIPDWGFSRMFANGFVVKVHEESDVKVFQFSTFDEAIRCWNDVNMFQAKRLYANGTALLDYGNLRVLQRSIVEDTLIGERGTLTIHADTKVLDRSMLDYEDLSTTERL